jgi:hypothetical protein
LYNFLSSGFPIGTFDDPVGFTWLANGFHQSQRLGTCIAFFDYNNDGAFDVLVGAPRTAGADPQLNAELGAVLVFQH